MTVVSRAALSNHGFATITTEGGYYSIRHSEYYTHTPQELIELGMWIVNQGHKFKRAETKARLKNSVMRNT